MLFPRPLDCRVGTLHQLRVGAEEVLVFLQTTRTHTHVHTQTRTYFPCAHTDTRTQAHTPRAHASTHQTEHL